MCYKQLAMSVELLHLREEGGCKEIVCPLKMAIGQMKLHILDENKELTLPGARRVCEENMLEYWQDTSVERQVLYSTVTAVCKAGYLQPGQEICGLLIVGEKQSPPLQPQ